MINYYPFSKKQKDFFIDIIGTKYTFIWVEGGMRARKNVTALAAWATFLERSNDEIHLAIGATVATAGTNIIESNGFGLKHIFKGRCRDGKYKENTALYISMPDGSEKIVIIVGGAKSDSYTRFEGYSIGSVFYDQFELLHLKTIKKSIQRTIAAEDRKHIVTANTTHPDSEIYTLIEQNWKRTGRYIYYHFTMWDNPAINKDRRREIVSEYDIDSVWFKNDILGERVGLDDLVYDLKELELVDEIDLDEHIMVLDLSIDTGYAVSAFAATVYGLSNKRRVYVLDTDYFQPTTKHKKAPSEYCSDIKDLMDRNVKEYQRGYDTQLVDSADAAIRNQMSYQYGIDLDPSKKYDKKQMIQYVQDLLSLGRVRVLINKGHNDKWVQEHRRYRTKEDSDDVIKKHDHTCDNMQYYVCNNLNKLGLGD